MMSMQVYTESVADFSEVSNRDLILILQAEI